MRSMKALVVLASAIPFVMMVAACGGQNFSMVEGESNFGQQVTYNKEVDVLWVVDTSGSMAKHQDYLASQVSKFVDGLNATGLDYQIGVTTMDMSGSGQKGRLLAQAGTPTVLTKSTPNLLALLKGRIQAGQNGSATERGLEATLAALAMDASGMPNEGFMRKDALLNVIFLTNENDKSSTAVNYIAALDALKPALPLGDRSWIAHFMGVTPDDNSCKTAEWGFSSPGTAYIALANASGGAKESICDADFARALTNVKERVLSLLTEFLLDRKPNEKTIKVFVDGLEISKIVNETDSGWSYRASNNAIRFHGDAIPKAGSRIHVAFDPEGLK